jgi:putative thioredoxin
MNTAANVIEVSIQNFQSEVVEKSKQVPVLLEFYANEAPASRALAPVLRRLAGDYQGKVVLARVNIRESPQLVQQLQVRTLPTIKIIFQGQMVQNLEGPQEDANLRKLLDQLTMSPVELIRAEINALLASGNRSGAISMLRQAIEEEPKNVALQAELCDLLIMDGKVSEAKKLLAALPESTEGISKPRMRIHFMELAAGLDAAKALAGAIDKNPDNLQARIDLAVRMIANDEMESALEQLLTVMKKDRTFADEIARKTMIQVFELLGKGNELATAYRRKMFTFLH